MGRIWGSFEFHVLTQKMNAREQQQQHFIHISITGFVKLVHRRVTPQHLYTWVERDKVQ